MAEYLILGTAGHIDHGKTSLIRALTGTDTDRLPEEKRRGITIELGFAQLAMGELRLGIVDVPGHERFVRNMLAGATGMDLALLVVAADDSVKPQTQEHLDILRYLNLHRGVIALTKCDLAEPDWLDLVEEEVRDLVSGTFLETAPIIRTSSSTGEGVEALKEELRSAAQKITDAKVDELRYGRSRRGPFRMAIDRVFTITGHGAVVTGSIGSGSVNVGDELRIEPGGVNVRVRGVQNHEETVDQAGRGQRAAINVAGIRHDEIVRGQELASPGYLRPSRLFTVQLTLLKTVAKPLKDRARVRLHVGTAEVLCTVRLLDRAEIPPGETAPVQLYLREATVATWSQPLVVRRQSPVETIGGGIVLDPDALPLRQPDGETLKQLADLNSENPLERAAAAVFFADLREWQADDLARLAGVVDGAAVEKVLCEQGVVCEVPLSPTRSLRLHQRVVERLCGRIEAALDRLHQQNPLKLSFDRSRLSAGFSWLGHDLIFEALLTQLKKQGRVKLTATSVGLAGRGPKLSQNERKLLGELVEKYRQAGLEPPTVKQIQAATAKNRDSVPHLVTLAEGDGQLVQINNDFFLHPEAVENAQRQLAERLAEQLSEPQREGKGLTVSEIREILDTTRKYAVPLCEYFDRIGFTRRDGDVRVLADTARIKVESS